DGRRRPSVRVKPRRPAGRGLRAVRHPGGAVSGVVAAADVAGRWRSARRILGVRLDNLGDVLMCTPALAAVARSLPGARLTRLAPPPGAALAPHLPMLEGAIAFHAPWVKHPGLEASDFATATQELVATLAARRFDAAVIFTTCTQSALPAALA